MVRYSRIFSLASPEETPLSSKSQPTDRPTVCQRVGKATFNLLLYNICTWVPVITLYPPPGNTSNFLSCPADGDKDFLLIGEETNPTMPISTPRCSFIVCQESGFLRITLNYCRWLWDGTGTGTRSCLPSAFFREPKSGIEISNSKERTSIFIPGFLAWQPCKSLVLILRLRFNQFIPNLWALKRHKNCFRCVLSVSQFSGSRKHSRNGALAKSLEASEGGGDGGCAV